MKKTCFKSQKFSSAGLLMLLFLSPVYAASLTDSSEQGFAAYEKGDYRQSVLLFDSLLSRHPEYARAWYYRALAYVKSGCLLQGKIAYTDVISHCPKTEEARLAAIGITELNEAAKHSSPTTATSSSAVTATTTSTQSSTGVTPPAEATEQLPDLCKIPYEVINKRIHINARIAGQMVSTELDTGSDQVVIPQDSMQQFGISLPSLGNPIGTYKTGQKMWQVKADIEAGNLKRNAMTVKVMGPGPFPGAILLGNSFFEGYRMEEDPKGSQFILSHSNQDSNLSHAYNNGNSIRIPFHYGKTNKQLIIPVKVNGRDIEAMFDTGSNGLSFTQQLLGKLGISVDQTLNPRHQTISNSSIQYTTAYFDLHVFPLGLPDVKGIIVDARDAEWGTGYPCIGPDVFENAGYSWAIDRDKKIFSLKKIY